MDTHGEETAEEPMETSIFAQDLGSFTQPENQDESDMAVPEVTPHHIPEDAEVTYQTVEAATSRGKV